jgi:hypothetical protein
LGQQGRSYRRARYPKRSMEMMKNIKLLILILVLMISGCEGKPKDNVYHAKEIDSLNFLIKHSDIIALVKISDGMQPTDKPATEFKDAVTAQIVELIYGEAESNFIKILNSTVYTTPGIVEHQLYLSNGEFIYFLKKFGSSYKPLTPFSTVRFRNGKGAPIWKQDKTGSMPEIDKDEITEEIKEGIEQRH